MNINDNQLHDLINSTERRLEKKIRTRRIICASLLSGCVIALSIVGFSIFFNNREILDRTLENMNNATQNASTATHQNTPTPLPDGTTWDPNAGSTPEPFHHVYWEPWTETQDVKGIETTVNIDLRHIRTGFPGIKYPVIEVVPGAFDVDFAKKAVEYFFDDEYYEYNYTKSDYELEIKAMEEFKKGTDLDEIELEGFNEKKDSLEYAMKKAPEDNNKAHIALNKVGRMFLKAYLNDNCFSRLYIANGNEEYGGTFRFSRGDFDKAYEPSEVFGADENKSSEEITKEMDALSETVNYADEIVHYFDEDMHYAFGMYGHAYNPSSATQNIRKIRADDTAEKCYILYYTREYAEGISGTIGETRVNGGEIKKSNTESDAAIWFPEVIIVVLDEEGIESFTWHNKTNIVKVVEDDSDIISPEQAREVFEKNIFLTEWDLPQESKTELTISKLFIDMVKIKSNDGRYLMVPAYILKGVQNVTLPNSNKHDHYMDIDEKNLLVINALDGSIIN